MDEKLAPSAHYVAGAPDDIRSISPAATHSSPASFRVLGIDPGLNVTGYGVLEIGTVGPCVCEAGIVRGVQRGSLTARLAEIHSGVADVIASLQPAAMALEQLYSHYRQPRTAILMGHARGVICLAAAQAGIPVTHYSATQIKKVLTGSGRAPKRQMQEAIQRELRLAEIPEPADVADALAIALCHYYLKVRQNGSRDFRPGQSPGPRIREKRS